MLLKAKYDWLTNTQLPLQKEQLDLMLRVFCRSINHPINATNEVPPDGTIYRKASDPIRCHSLKKKARIRLQWPVH